VTKLVKIGRKPSTHDKKRPPVRRHPGKRRHVARTDPPRHRGVLILASVAHPLCQYNCHTANPRSADQKRNFSKDIPGRWCNLTDFLPMNSWLSAIILYSQGYSCRKHSCPSQLNKSPFLTSRSQCCSTSQYSKRVMIVNLPAVNEASDTNSSTGAAI